MLQLDAEQHDERDPLGHQQLAQQQLRALIKPLAASKILTVQSWANSEQSQRE
jgi:hypothetical protein